MFLFKTNDEKQIEVYELKPKEDEIRKFKRSELDKIPADKRFVKHVVHKHGSTLSETSELVTCPHFDRHSEIVGLNYSDMFVYVPENSANSHIREVFISGDLSGFEFPRFYRIMGKGSRNENTANMYLFTTEGYTSPYRSYEMHNILALPQSLYLLHLLESGKIEYFEGQDFSELLKLFDIEMVKKIDWSHVEDLSKFGLVGDAVKRSQEAVKATEDVVMLSKKNSQI